MTQTMTTWQRWFVTLWFTAVLVVGVFALRDVVLEREQQAQREQWDTFMCQLAPETC